MKFDLLVSIRIYVSGLPSLSMQGVKLHSQNLRVTLHEKHARSVEHSRNLSWPSGRWGSLSIFLLGDQLPSARFLFYQLHRCPNSVVWRLLIGWLLPVISILKGIANGNECLDASGRTIFRKRRLNVDWLRVSPNLFCLALINFLRISSRVGKLWWWTLDVFQSLPRLPSFQLADLS